MTDTVEKLWEILVPTIRRTDEKPYRLRFHRVWDAKVQKISGGLTIMRAVKGRWLSKQEELFEERMIPVRFIATEQQASDIIDMTMIYYDQLAIMCYTVSEHVIVRHRGE
jgi:hypothetical protein